MNRTIEDYGSLEKFNEVYEQHRNDHSYLYTESNVLSSDHWRPFYAAGGSSDTVFILEPFQQLYRVIFWKCQIRVADIPNLG